MKKIVLIIVTLMLLPSATHAYLDYYRHYLFFSFGLSPSTIEKMDQAYIIQGPSAENIKIDNSSGRVAFTYTEKDYKPGMQIRLDKNEMMIQLKQVGWNDYEFWKIHGSVDNRRFTLVGLTIEGKFLENKLFFHSVPIIAILLAVFFLCRHWRKK